jgi:Fe-S oxidoreductase
MVEEDSTVKQKKSVPKKISKVKHKPTQQDKLEAANLMEDVRSILEPCIKCGMCKGVCPVFKVLCEEEVSPRGRTIVLSEKFLTEALYKCNLCRACENNCALEIKLCDAFLKARQAAALLGKGIKQNDEMIENIRKTGNPFGEKEVNKDKLYCC